MRMLYSMTCQRPLRLTAVTCSGPLNFACAQPRQQRMDELPGQAVFVMRITLNQAAERRAGHDALVAIEGVFVFLVRDQRMNFAAADQHDVPGLGAPEIFLQKNALGIIHMPQPGPRVLHRLAQNGVDRARRRAERIFDDERLRMPRQDFFGLDSVRRHERLRKGDFEIGAQLPGEIPFAFNPHRLAGRTENADTRFQQILRPRVQRPVNGLRNDDINAVFPDERDRDWGRRRAKTSARRATAGNGRNCG